MNSDLENAIQNASYALLDIAKEAKKLTNELYQLRAQVERHEDFNQSLKQLFDTYYGE